MSATSKTAARAKREAEIMPCMNTRSPLGGVSIFEVGYEASPQSGLGVGCMRCSSSKKPRGLDVRAQARRISISLSFSVAGVSSFLSPPRSAMRCGAWKVLLPAPCFPENNS